MTQDCNYQSSLFWFTQGRKNFLSSSAFSFYTIVNKTEDMKKYKDNYGGVEEDLSFGAILGFFAVMMIIIALFFGILFSH